MSCHFHLMRKRKAAAARKAEEAVQIIEAEAPEESVNTEEEAVLSAETEAPEEEVKAEEKPAKKASKGRRKGDA